MKKLDIACIIDDDKMFTYLVSKQMKMINFCETVITFNNGFEALKYLKPILGTPETLPSVILLDLNMPILDGWQFLDEFKHFEISKKITLYIVSSSIDKADHLKAATYKEVSNFYVKPINKEHLTEMLIEVNSA